MQAIRFPARGEVRYGAQADPVAGSGQIVLKVRASGICHSDFEALKANDGTGAFPLMPGDDPAGRVSGTGRDVTGFRLGDRVVTSPLPAASRSR